jgi:hypothetical protein
MPATQGNQSSGAASLKEKQHANRSLDPLEKENRLGRIGQLLCGDENQKRAETNQTGPQATEDRPKLSTGNENTGDKIEYLTPDLTCGRKNEREPGFPNHAEKKRALRFQDL